MANIQNGPPVQAASTTKPSLRNYAKQNIRAKRMFATLSNKLPEDDINIPGIHPTAGRAGIDAEIWKTYVSEASDHDKNLISSWNEDLDVLLIFAGLFSAVLTAFIIESRKDLQEDYQKTSADLLHILIDQSLNRTVPIVIPFEVAPSAIQVNVLWFSSLACSLISALGAMLGKQWVRHYTNHLFGGGAHLLRARQHQAALLAAKQWRMSGVIMTIPILMHLSLFLFFVGLYIFLLGDDTIIVRTVMVISIIGVLLYVVITILPSICQHCPFGTPFSRFLPPFYPTSREHHESDQHSASDLDAKCLTWLMTYTTSTHIAHSAAMAVSGLACTPSQQDILYTGGGVNVLTKALAACTVEENGSLTIQRESLDTASLLLFGAHSLLHMSGSCFAQNDDHKCLNVLLRKFDSNKFLDIRSNFDAADSAAAIWCILAHNSFSLRGTSDSTELVSRLRKIPTSFEIPAPNRAFKELLNPCMHLVLSTQNDPVLCSWAAERMFNFWEFEGRPSLGKTGAQILLKVLMGASQTLDHITCHYRVNDIISFGGIEPIIQALLSLEGNINAQESVTKLLDWMSSIDHGIDAISCAVELLIQALLSLMSNDRVQISVANILDKISSTDRGIDVIVSCAGFGSLIRALAPLDGSVQARIARIFVKISSCDRGVNTFISSAGVEPLIQALTSLSSSNAQNDIVETLAQISSSDPGVNAIIAGAGIGPLIHILCYHYDPYVQTHVATTLARISSSSYGIDAIISNKAVGPLSQALTSLLYSDDARKNIAKTLTRVLSSNCGVDAIVSSAGVNPLIQALASEQYSNAWDCVAETLAQLSSSNQGIDAIISNGGVRPLLHALKSWHYSNAWDSLADTLARMSSSDQGIDAIISSAGVEPLIRALASQQYSSVWDSVAGILAQISSSNLGVDAIISGEGVRPLTWALESEQYSNAWGRVAETFAKISSSNQGIDAIISGGGVRPLIQAFTSVEYSNASRDHVAETLAQISSSNQGIDAIIFGQGAEPLIQALVSEQWFAHGSVTRILANISSSESGINAVISYAEPLIQALQSQEQDIQTKSITLLCRIATAVGRRSERAL